MLASVSAKWSPLWSCMLEYQVFECAFASMSMMLMFCDVRWLIVFVISVSMSCVLMVESVGGMYAFAKFMFCFVVGCIVKS